MKGGKSWAIHFARLALFLASASQAFAGTNDARWWPIQKMPAAVLRTSNQQEFPAPRLALQMMVQSVAGLAAKSVNEDRGRAMVWVDNGGGDLEEWYSRLISTHPGLKTSGAFTPWQLVDRFAARGVIKGYILYHLDESSGEDCSVNVATSLAGLLDGIIVDESLEHDALAHGLKLLLDARGRTQKWCFETYREQFNRHMLCTQDPRKPHARDFAIAQKVFTLFGHDQSLSFAMEWLDPLSPILGWNSGDEFENTDLSSGLGDIQTATDWCLNLPVLMAGAETNVSPKIKNLDPKKMDWNDQRSAVSFILTDGDNVQWLEGNFFLGSAKNYWSDPDRGKIPFGWSSCFAHLAQLCPEAVDYAAATASPNDSFIEWGGGYYYPDHFASRRADRRQLLAQHATRTWDLMQRTGTRLVGFNFTEWDSRDARRACEIFAAQTDGLLGILAFQYAPYEAGAGGTYWVKDRNGIAVPVISARYSIWEHSNDRDRAGTPAKIAREIRQSSVNTPRYDWVIVHAWSYFKRAPGADENAENMPQENAEAHGGARGYKPAEWCAERLPENIRVVSPEELVWRIRMKHDPAQTKQFIARLP
jgi:hypothetical protein